jgi:hypothetical protein
MPENDYRNAVSELKLGENVWLRSLREHDGKCVIHNTIAHFISELMHVGFLRARFHAEARRSAEAQRTDQGPGATNG